MFAPKIILAPIALSPACGWAAEYAAHLARRFSSQLLFLHVGNCGRETVEAFLGAKAKGIPHEIKICQGDPADVIVPLARDTGVGLIVMPTHAHGRFRRFLLGSVTAKVLHDVDCPVLTGVHHETAPLSAQADIRHMVCAVDTGEGFVPVIRGALEFNAHFHATLMVTHALPAADETSDNRGEIELRKYLFHAAEEKFGRLRREVEGDVKITFAGGAVSTVVREAALRVGADLVVIGRGHTQRALGRLRTHAYSIIRNSPCPVLSI
jgi:nucleotide-binding universal stress UspA family protein